MNNQDERYFKELSKDRAESADMLEKPSMRGVKKSVVEKYSDQAHFIYELIQNADDAKATYARFELEDDKLYFAHNGTRHFSVTNPDNEEDDTKDGTLGDVNAITSIANSNKTKASIGKFGVGFKAVFQYTNTPYIYDTDLRFRIERFIVPEILEKDNSRRKSDETLFVFPFDNVDKDASVAYDDISERLNQLSFPTLFLSSLQSIQIRIGDKRISYDKKIIKKFKYDDINVEKISLHHKENSKDQLERLWLFSRLDENNRPYSVGFSFDKDGILQPIVKSAFCFFPTKEITGLNFIIHAPFLLTDSREGIKAGNTYNNHLISLLADLSAKAIVILKDIGENQKTRIIDDSILNIIPYDKEIFSDINDKSKISFMPFFDFIQKAFQTKEIIPSSDGYASKENAYWAAVPTLAKLFSNKQLAEITGNENAKWVFVSKGRDECARNNKVLAAYLDFIVKDNITEDLI